MYNDVKRRVRNAGSAKKNSVAQCIHGLTFFYAKMVIMYIYIYVCVTERAEPGRNAKKFTAVTFEWGVGKHRLRSFSP